MKMKVSVKKVLEEAFAPPPPKRKQLFLKKIARPQITTASFVLLQISYIRKRIWVISVLVLLFACIGTKLAGTECMGLTSSVLPFAAVCVLTEKERSKTYGMAELEMASRFSLKSVLLARLSAIGFVHLGIFAVLVPFVKSSVQISWFRTAVYLIVPYLLTAVLGLAAARKFQEKDSVYLCMGMAVLVSFGVFGLQRNVAELYEAGMFGWWCAAVLYLLAQMWKELKKVMNNELEFVALR